MVLSERTKRSLESACTINTQHHKTVPNNTNFSKGRLTAMIVHHTDDSSIKSVSLFSSKVTDEIDEDSMMDEPVLSLWHSVVR